LKITIMKIKNIFNINIWLAGLLIITASCTKDFDEINTDPNRITEASNGSLLVYAQREAAYLYLTGGGTLGQWSQYTADRSATNSFTNFDPEGEYDALYHNILYQLEQIILSANVENENGNRHYYAIAHIMQIWNMAAAVELWGDLPYYDALKGGTYEGGTVANYITPRFDTQEEILKNLIGRLNDMNDFIKASSGVQGIVSAGSYDIYAGGDMSDWRKFANSLQAKLLLDLSVADQQYAVEGLNRIFSDPELYPIFASESDYLGIKWQGLGALPANISSVAYSLYNNGDYKGFTSIVNNGIIRILVDNKDPRRFTFFQRPKSLPSSTFDGYGSDSIQMGDYYYNKDSLNVMSGFPPARTESTPSGALRPSTSIYSTIGGGFANVYRTDFIMDFAELCFVKAEAKLLGVSALAESASSYYEAGIRANFDYFQDVHNLAIEDEVLYTTTTFVVDPDDVYSEDSIANFLAQPGVVLTGDPASDLEKIITQRYVSTYYNGNKAFSMIRRTGFPKLDFFDIGTSADLGFPTRYKYPEIVGVTNGDNLIDAIGKLTNNIWDGQVWIYENSPLVEPAFDYPIEDYLIYDVFTCEVVYPLD
ncbi:SusD/RagB family nutrient-binding outer membrane lipoprotein, partial [Desulfosarcina sp.]|nr:SusD/RagB family nutrient-binding outer membrane lipoprotein [Desulfosarcina sp.]